MNKKMIFTGMIAALSFGLLTTAMFTRKFAFTSNGVSASGDFVVDATSIESHEDYYTAIAIDDNNHSVQTKFVNVSLNNDKIYATHRSISYFTNLDPMRRFSEFSIDLDFTGNANGNLLLVECFFSYNPLNFDDIFAGNYQDLSTAISSIYGSGRTRLTAEYFPEMLNARYVMGVIYNATENIDVEISGIKLSTPCIPLDEGGEPEAVPVGTYTSFPARYQQEVEDAGHTWFSNRFLFTNGAYSFEAPEYGMSEYEFTSIQPMQSYGTIMNNIIDIDGFGLTMQEEMDGMMMAALQKKVDDSTVYSYLITLAPLSFSPMPYMYISMMCTTQYQYIEQDTSWPKDKLLAAGASSGLVNAFNDFNISNAKYSIMDSHSTLKLKEFPVLVSVSNTTNTKDEVDAYVNHYDELSGYTVSNYSLMSTGYEITKDNSPYTLILQMLGDSDPYSMMYVFLRENGVYDHLPLAEIKEENQIDRLPVVNLDGSFSYDYEYSYTLVGRNISEQDLSDFIDTFVNDYGYTYAGNLRSGVLIENPEVYVEDFIYLSINKVDTSTYEFEIVNNDNTNTSSLIEYLDYIAGAGVFVQAIDSDSSAYQDEKYNLVYIAENSEYRHSFLTLENGTSQDVQAILDIFDSETFTVTQTDNNLYQISLKEGGNADDLFFKFDLVEGGLYIHIGRATETSYTHSYSEVNSALASTYGDTYVPLTTGQYAYGTNYAEAVGTLKEMIELEESFIANANNNSHLEYVEKLHFYVDQTNGYKVSSSVTSVNSTGIFRFAVIYEEFNEPYTDYVTYEDSGISSLPIMANFPALPELAGEKAYEIIKSSDTEVVISVNKDFDIYNFYQLAMENAGFTSDMKTIGNVTYDFYDEYDYNYQNYIFTFRKLESVTYSEFISALQTSGYDDEVSHLYLDENWRYYLDLEHSEAYDDSGYIVFYIFDISYSDFETAQKEHGITNPIYTENTRYSWDTWSINSMIQIELQWRSAN